MYSLFRDLSKQLKDFETARQQKEISEELYSSIASNFSEYESKGVQRICDILDNKHFYTTNIYARKIHGSRSYVEFKYKSNTERCELADMYMLSLAVSNNSNCCVFGKIALVQNKKEVHNSIAIDKKQLFLLRNFPKFIGSKGYLREEEFLLHNTYEQLGHYGIIQDDGNIVLVNSRLVDSLCGNVYTIKYNDIANMYGTSFCSRPSYDNSVAILPQWFCLDRDIPCYNSVYKHRYDLPYFVGSLPFLRFSEISLNNYDLVKNLSNLNIGEPIFCYSDVFDEQLFKMAYILVNKAGLGNKVKFKFNDDYIPDENNKEDSESIFGNSLVIITINYIDD
jgi:hypothetical protein